MGVMVNHDNVNDIAAAARGNSGDDKNNNDRINSDNHVDDDNADSDYYFYSDYTRVESKDTRQ